MASPSKWIPIGSTQEQPINENQINTNNNIQPFNQNLSKNGKEKESVDNVLKPTTIDIIGGIFCHICLSTFGNKKEFEFHYKTHDTGSAETVYTCVVCHRGFADYRSFRGHCYLVHVNKNKFKCELCQKTFSKFSVLQTHIKSVHESIEKCSKCKKEFNSRKDFLLHKIVHQNNYDGPPYDCQACGEHIETSDECEDHIEQHSTMFFSCPICNEDIAEIQQAADHLAKHFGKEHINTNSEPSEIMEISNESSLDLIGGIFCIYCSNTFKCRPDFDNHFLVEHTEKEIVYSCNICGKEYDKYFHLARHCYDHTSKDKFECEECFRTFPRLSLLVIHMEVYHSTRKVPSDRPFSCLQCSHGFKTHRRLTDHYRSVHNIYHYQCPEANCKKTFNAPKDLVLHLKCHKSVHNWCRQCGLRFYSLQACERHLQVHRKKLYSCPVCSRKYGEKYQATKHLAQHFSAVLHICKVCSKVYSNRNRLVQHMKVHNEVKPFTCSFCCKGFTKSDLLQQHINMHTGVKPFKCTNCPKTFASYPNLRKHLRNMHNVKVNSKLILNENNNRKNKKDIDSKTTLADKALVNDINMPEKVKIDNVCSNNNIENIEVLECLEQKQNYFEDLDNVEFDLEGPGENQWASTDIEPMLLQMLEASVDSHQIQELEDIHHIQEELWVPSPNLQEFSVLSAGTPPIPYEYGPELVADDAPLAHIDPRLALRPPPPARFTPPEPARFTPLEPAAPYPDAQISWEPPLLTKLDYASDFGMEVNIDLF